METPATIAISALGSGPLPQVAPLEDDDGRALLELVQRVESVGPSGAHPSFPRDVPVDGALTPTDSDIYMRRRHAAITCSNCRVTYLGLPAPQGSSETGQWVCERCADATPDGAPCVSP